MASKCFKGQVLASGEVAHCAAPHAVSSNCRDVASGEKGSLSRNFGAMPSMAQDLDKFEKELETATISSCSLIFNLFSLMFLDFLG